MIFLVRHGESTLNAVGIKYGRLDPPLTMQGTIQAAAVAEKLQGRVEQVVASPLIRAYTFAGHIAYLLGLDQPTLIDDLAERSFGAAEGMTRDEIRERWPTGDVPGMESYADAATRARTALDRITAPTAVITHAGVIRGLLGLDHSPANGEVLEYAGRGHRTPLPASPR